MSRGPGKAHRKGLSITELTEMFPDEATASAWFESVLWPDGRCCGHCGSERTSPTPNRKPMPYWCSDCREYFSVKTGTAMQRSKIPLRKWAIAIYLCLTSLKSVSSLKLRRDIKVTQPTAWFMLHRIREAWALQTPGNFDGPVEADESFFGGKTKNMHAWQREERGGARGPSGKMAVVGVKDRATKQVRARVVPNTTAPWLTGFVAKHRNPDAMLYTDEASAYQGFSHNHEAVKHGVGEFVRGMAHTNGMESFWSMLKRAHTGTFHKLSPKHLNRYVQEFAGKHNIRDSGTLEQMRHVVARLVGRNLLYRDLIAPNGLPSGARPPAG